MSDEVGATLCCVVFVLIGLGLAVALILAMITLVRKKESSKRAADRRVEFMTAGDPSQVASILASAISSQLSAGGFNQTKVTSASSLGLVVQHSNSFVTLWEIRVDFVEREPLRGVVYLNLARGGDGVMNAPETANRVFDIAITALRQADPNVQIHGH